MHLKVVKEKQLDLLYNQSGKFVSIKFKRKEGQTRLLNGRLGIHKGRKLGWNWHHSYDTPSIGIYDVQIGEYRVVKLRESMVIKASGHTFQVVRQYDKG